MDITGGDDGQTFTFVMQTAKLDGTDLSDKRVTSFTDYTQSHTVVADRPTIVVEYTGYSSVFSEGSDATTAWIEPNLALIADGTVEYEE